MKTQMCEMLGVEMPIVSAPMGGAAGPQLVAAVSNAGGLGAIPLWGGGAELVRRGVAEVRALTSRPFSVNINLGFDHEAAIDACLEHDVRIISLFWGDPAPVVARAKSGGAKIMHSVGSAEEARRAVDAGVDIIVAQGWEAGGHVWGKVATMALVPAVVDAVGPVPVIAAGGISDGRGLAAALSLGASAVWIGTRFLASQEAGIHQQYREHILSSNEDSTTFSDDLYDLGWPDAPHRVLTNSTVREWQAAGSPPIGQRPGEGDKIGLNSAGNPVLRYQCITPGPNVEGDIEAMSMWAGQGLAQVNTIMPAAEIVHEIVRDADQVLAKLVR